MREGERREKAGHGHVGGSEEWEEKGQGQRGGAREQESITFFLIKAISIKFVPLFWLLSESYLSTHKRFKTFFGEKKNQETNISHS